MLTSLTLWHRCSTSSILEFLSNWAGCSLSSNSLFRILFLRKQNFLIRNLQFEVVGTSQRFQSYLLEDLESWIRKMLSIFKNLGHSKSPKSFRVRTKVYIKGNRISSCLRLRMGKHRMSTRVKRRDFRERHYINMIWQRDIYSMIWLVILFPLLFPITFFW